MNVPLRCAALSLWTFALAFVPSGCHEPARLPSASAPVIIEQPPTPPVLAAPEPGPEVALLPPGPELIVQDQPWLRGIRSWDGALIAVGDIRDGAGGSYRIEPIDRPERAHAVPLILPGTKRVIDVAMQGDTPVALVLTDNGLALAFHRGASWSIEPVPEPSRALEDVILAAAPGALVLLCPGQLHVLRAGAWKSVSVGPIPVPGAIQSSRASRHALLLADHLLLGFDAGEWGGALVSLDTGTGAWKAYPQVDEPVKDLVVEPNGRPWVAMGLSHLGGIKGRLSRLDASGWTAVAKVDGFIKIVGGPVTKARLAWELPPASFGAIAFDEESRLLLLTNALGVVRRDGKHWTRLTPAWPEHVYVSGLAVRGSLLMIATFDAGVLLWDVATGKARRVELTQ